MYPINLENYENVSPIEAKLTILYCREVKKFVPKCFTPRNSFIEIIPKGIN